MASMIRYRKRNEVTWFYLPNLLMNSRKESGTVSNSWEQSTTNSQQQSETVRNSQEQLITVGNSREQSGTVSKSQELSGTVENSRKQSETVGDSRKPSETFGDSILDGILKKISPETVPEPLPSPPPKLLRPSLWVGSAKISPGSRKSPDGFCCYFPAVFKQFRRLEPKSPSKTIQKQLLKSTKVQHIIQKVLPRGCTIFVSFYRSSGIRKKPLKDETKSTNSYK